jgi:quercetin dioxygenase-like cupin family protein
MIRRSPVAVKRHAQHPFWSVSEGGFIMNNGIHWFLDVLCAIVFVVVAANPALAQDAVKVDPQHYKVESENAQVRVLRITYGPHEKSVMHGHPASVAVFLTDGQAKFTLPNGKTEERSWKAGQTMWLPAGKHLPENVGDKPFELILVELKAKPTKAAAPKTP